MGISKTQRAMVKAEYDVQLMGMQSGKNFM